MRDAEPSDREAALLAVIERLEGRIAQLEDALGFTYLTPIEWGLTAAMMKLFGCLMARELMTPDAAMQAMYAARVGADDEPHVKIVDVQICKMRAKLKPFGITILTRWGQGYYLDPATKEACRAMMPVAAQPVAA